MDMIMSGHLLMGIKLQRRCHNATLKKSRLFVELTDSRV